MESIEEKLIEFVKRNEFLYNKKHKQYKDQFLRNIKFDQLATEINVNSIKLKHRWRTLRDKFKKELNNQQSDKLSHTDRKPWKWMEMMMFLKDVYPTEAITTRPIKRDDDESTSTTIVNNAINEEDTTPMSMSFLNRCSNELFMNCDNSKKKSPDDPSSSDLISTATINNGPGYVMATEVIGGTTGKTKVQLFFDSMAKQVEEANISAEKFCQLQIELLKTMGDIIYS